MRINYLSNIIVSLTLLLTAWGCTPMNSPGTVTQLAIPDSLQHKQDNPSPINPVADDQTTPEPEITVAEELKDLENLGQWEAGKPEEIPIEPKITYDFPVTMNKQVEYYLNFFQHKHKRSFHRWLERSGKYLPMIQAELKEAGLPLDLAYLPMIESGYSLTAYSSAHAAGPWQFISSTGKLYGLKIDSYIDERRNVVKATQAAISFLSDLHDQFGDWQLAVAAYNAGGRKINRGLKRYKVKTFWQLAQKPYLKTETKRYVPKLIAAIIIARDPEKYGFTDIKYETPLLYGTVEVPPWTSLRAAAVACNTDFDELRNLNRELRKLLTPPGMAVYPLKVPVGKEEMLARNLSRVHATITTSYKTHVVKKNETINRICNRYNLNKTTLLKANNLRQSGLKKGQRLRIPFQTTSYILVDDNDLSADSRSHKGLILHKISKGETISHIASRYNIPAHMIAAWNGISDLHRIRAGQQLALYLNGGPINNQLAAIKKKKEQRAALAGKPVYHTVRKGDSLWTIGRRYKLKPDQIRQWNKLSNNLIHPGTRLLVSDPATIGPISLVKPEQAPAKTN